MLLRVVISIVRMVSVYVFQRPISQPDHDRLCVLVPPPQFRPV